MNDSFYTPVESDTIIGVRPIIQITEAEISDILRNHLSRLNNKGIAGVLSGVILTIVVAFLTADFKAFLGICEYIWEAFFLFALIFSVAYVMVWGLRHRNDMNIDSIRRSIIVDIMAIKCNSAKVVQIQPHADTMDTIERGDALNTEQK